ncbi:MAG: hypothetical protein IPO08_21685 [Xanthomonadales bacterium]|nr:hypothetical protein [Xanthomonadales bacterium]
MSDQHAVRDYEDLDELLDHLEGLLREGTHIDETGRTHACLSEEVEALHILARHGRFRIVTEIGKRQITGYWRGNDPAVTKGGVA